jgi:hypothetical protein
MKYPVNLKHPTILLGALVAGFLAVIYLLVWMLAPSDTDKFVKYHMQFIRGMLKDADSAKFKDVIVVTLDKKGHSLMILCGAVNSKNSFGGYVGYQRFYATWLSTHIDDGGAPFQDNYEDFCSGACRLEDCQFLFNLGR